ncbi:HAMP domain-containing sensor histidine kinase [Geodermatophilus sp. DSM 44513]|uniref:sensor histidine kinase n=1 Tax=Geodermatophilus sp. DSM 44513 TaxID=1528104 RepID=UPI001282A9CC|nr:HAMP domain-containing sensor histidine kinase [Geodermatophilus sp. DSM 44513]WNV73635.1 HAMP domain-containing sensor histidine kinase [Geodermatophilus sp. DSM 44513]
MSPTAVVAPPPADGPAGGTLRRRRAPWPPSLRGRATLALTAVAVALTTALAVGVWVSATQYLLYTRQNVTLAQAVANAAQVQRGLSAEGFLPAELLSQLPRETGSVSLLADDGEWSTTSLRIGREELPEALRTAVARGEPSRQRIAVDGDPYLAVGLPLPGLQDAYFEVFPLHELDDTVRVLGVVLTSSVLAAAPLAAAVGWWVTRPALRPLERISAAAAAIAGGDLGARIDPRGDPSLAPIAASFNATAAALEQRVRADARFAADVSHELRSPLTTVLAAVSLVEAHADRLDPDGREGLALLRSEVRDLERLVADLLEISRTDAGDPDLVVEDVRLAALVGQTLARRAAAGGGSTRPTVAAAAADVVVRADKRRLERVLRNLVDNADTHGGGLTAVTVERAGPHACVLVDDAGPGVPEEERGVVFERFARGSRSTRASSDGSGLGLALVSRHVQLMGGSVTVTDAPGGGARFVVRLPAVDPAGGRP